MRLYDLSSQYNDIIDLLEQGTDNESLEAMLGGLEIAFDDKAESIVKLMKSKQADFDALALESKRLSDRAIKVAKEQEWLHDYLQRNMEAMGKKEVKSIMFKIQFQNNPPSLAVLNESAIPGKYFKQPPTPPKALDKRLLLEDLKNNVVVEGAEIKQGHRLVIK